MSKPAARKGDSLSCNQHGGQKIVEGSANVNINGKPAARVGDSTHCEGNITGSVKSGSGSVSINGKAAARQNDPIDHAGAKISEGSGNVMIGSGGNPVNFGGKGAINIGGNGNPVNIGK